ncbi:MAG TPA: hypothetical protein VFD06_04185 [Candidatus Polarisedimenticolia bacterium]|nr:hypothetical protein [Candidatus Polarisedimenticolia bacterium]
MSDAGPLALVPIVFGLSAFGPGYRLVRRAGWPPLETAVAGLALSVLLVGQASFVIGLLWLPAVWRVLLLVACAAATIASVPEVVRLVRSDAGARTALVWFAILAVWGVGLQACVRNYSGGNIVYDWLDHYERSKFFLGFQPTDKLFSGALLPARPPLMNAFAAQILALTRPRFPCYQMTAALLGLLAYFPMLLVARLFSASRGLPRILAVVLMFQPMFLQNVSYSWTRMTAVFFTLSAIGFYVSGWRAGDGRRTLMAFACGAGAILTHYSSAPYVLFLALHFLLFALPRRPRPFRELAAIVVAATLVLLPWLAWASAVYGRETVVSAGLRSSGKPLPTFGANVLKAALNLRDTFVPPLLRDVPHDPEQQSWGWGRIRDEAFLMYQGNLPLALGSLAALFLATEALRAWRRRRAAERAGAGRASEPERGPPADSWRFWVSLAAFVILTGIGVQGGRDPFGLAHTAQQPLVMIGVSFLAARFGTWLRWQRLLAAAGLLLDALLGVLLQFWLQSYSLDLPSNWRGPLGLTFKDLTRMMATWNWGEKVSGRHLFVADAIGGIGWVLLPVLALLFAVAAATLLRQASRRATSSPHATTNPG